MALASLVVGMAASVLDRFYRTADLQPPEQEIRWQWNGEARLTLCLTQKGARDRHFSEFADLDVEGTLVALGEMSRASNPRDTGNRIGCADHPRQYIEVQEGGGETWRVMYALPGEQRSAIHARLGEHVRLLFQSEFHSDQIARFLLLDEAGPALAITLGAFGPHAFEEGHLTVSWGRVFGHRPTGCGGDEVARALRIGGDTDVSIAPGQLGSFQLHGVPYRFWNIQSVNVIDQPCVDGGDLTTWVLWRE